MKALGLILILIFSYPAVSCAEIPSASQLERARESLEKERITQEILEQAGKIYIQRIIVEGVTLLGDQEVRQIASSYEEEWLDREDIQQILDTFKQAYAEKGYEISVSYKIKKETLEISIAQVKKKG